MLHKNNTTNINYFRNGIMSKPIKYVQSNDNTF